MHNWIVKSGSGNIQKSWGNKKMTIDYGMVRVPRAHPSPIFSLSTRVLYHLSLPHPSPSVWLYNLAQLRAEKKSLLGGLKARPLCSILLHGGLCWDDKGALLKQPYCGYMELLHGEQLPATRNELCYAPWDPGTVCYCGTIYLVLKIIGISRRGRPRVSNAEKCLLDPLIAFSL